MRVIIPALTMAEQDRHKGGLDRAREEFLFMSIREMVVEFSEQTLKSDALLAETAIEMKLPALPADGCCVFPPTMRRTKLPRRCWPSCWNRPGTPQFRFPWMLPRNRRWG